MALVLKQAPLIEPISVADAKEYLRVDGGNEDALIGSLIVTSRLHVEAAFDLALITQSWMLALDRWPTGHEPIRLPLWPVQAITAARVSDATGTPQTLAASLYVSDTLGRPARLLKSRRTIVPEPGVPLNGIQIDFTAGFGASHSDVPSPIRQALMLLTAHWYEHRDPIEIGGPGTAIPTPISDLLEPYRQRRL